MIIAARIVYKILNGDMRYINSLYFSRDGVFTSNINGVFFNTSDG